MADTPPKRTRSPRVSKTAPETVPPAPTQPKAAAKAAVKTAPAAKTAAPKAQARGTSPQPAPKAAPVKAAPAKATAGKSATAKAAPAPKAPAKTAAAPRPKVVRATPIAPPVPGAPHLKAHKNLTREPLAPVPVAGVTAEKAKAAPGAARGAGKPAKAAAAPAVAAKAPRRKAAPLPPSVVMPAAAALDAPKPPPFMPAPAPKAEVPKTEASAAEAPKAAAKPVAKDTAKDGSNGEVRLPDPVEMTLAMNRIAEQAQRLVADFVARQAQTPADGTAAADPMSIAAPFSSLPANLSNLDPFNLGGAFMEMTARLMADPNRLIEAQLGLWQDYLALWQRTAQRLMGEEAEPVISPAKEDKRFKDKSWEESAVFDFIKQSYLLTAKYVQTAVRGVEGLEGKTAKKVDFFTRQFVDALSPSNFPLTNPEVLRVTLETGGDNLLKGLENLLSDLERGRGQLAISMTDYAAFEVGRNIAVTPGKVVFQNELMQLIQYAPLTETVHKTPLLIIPPWINKFYILDLKPANSLIRWLTEQGHTVFVISWVNPNEKLAAKDFEDYMVEGPLAALDAIKDATGEEGVNAIGYCIGGTLLSGTLAYMAAKKDARIKSAMYLVTLTDFTDVGELSVFIDEEQLGALESRMKSRGYLDGQSMATTFNMLRSNDLIWSFVVNNYLLGKDPFPFDLLYWNSDSTRMPPAMHSFYLRNMYQKNLLVRPGGITLKGVPIDLRTIKTPTFMLSTREDHIAPWKSTYAATQLYGGPVKFVLAASGHIAGVVNPPAANKYSHFLNDALPASPDDWLAGTTQVPGSWWPVYADWLKQYAGPQVPARTPGDGKLKPIEDAPGSYVKVRVVE
ncbi:polyhydroxyalkanoate synthase [Nitrospirillum amazonense]|uniref:Polyhydroxyalkanoate synthase n=1 Tax=Nitrospirillum amazonense TaxID=28077 RepID=A0A560KIP7_9PROT|nr:polyhydroxyalkanoate synthase [Nitrospirillum amazonense]